MRSAVGRIFGDDSWRRDDRPAGPSHREVIALTGLLPGPNHRELIAKDPATSTEEYMMHASGASIPHSVLVGQDSHDETGVTFSRVDKYLRVVLLDDHHEVGVKYCG
jgi:hypothetical protein